MSLDSIFKAYDVRGVVPDQLDAEKARAIGYAFAKFADAPKILVAHDMRPSGEELSTAFAEGITSTGTDVVNLGLASTDLLYYAAGKLDAPGAMFTRISLTRNLATSSGDRELETVVQPASRQPTATPKTTRRCMECPPVPVPGPVMNQNAQRSRARRQIGGKR